MANFNDNRYPWPTDPESNVLPETGANTRILFAEQDMYRQRKGNDDLVVVSDWSAITIVSDAEGFRGQADNTGSLDNPTEGDWYYNYGDENTGFREYRDGQWFTVEAPTDYLLGEGTGDAALIWGDGVYEDEAAARRLFDDGTLDPYTYSSFSVNIGTVFFDLSVSALRSVRGDYSVTSKKGSTPTGDIFYVIPRVISTDIAETTDNIPIEFLGGGFSGNKAQAGAHTFGNGFSIAASEEGLHLFLRTLSNSTNDDIEVKTRKVTREAGTVTATAISASTSFYIGEHDGHDSADTAAAGATGVDGDFYYDGDLLFYYRDNNRWTIATTLASMQSSGITYYFAESPATSHQGWESLSDFAKALDDGIFEHEILTEDSSRYIIYNLEDSQVYQVTDYTPGDEVANDTTPRRDILPNHVSHARHIDISDKTDYIDFPNDIDQGNIVQLEITPQGIDEDSVAELRISGYDYSGRILKDSLLLTENDVTVKTDFFFASPPTGRTTRYKIIQAANDGATAIIRSQYKSTEVTFKQSTRLLPGWTIEARKGTIPFTYVGVSPSEMTIALTRNTALQLDFTTVAYDSLPYTDITGRKVNRDDGSGSTGIELNDEKSKGALDFIEASDTLFTGWQAYLDIVEPGTIIPIRVPLVDATFTIDHKLEQAPMVVGDRRPGPPFRGSLRDVMLEGTMLFTRERDWTRLFKNNIAFEDCVLVFKNASYGGFPYELKVEFGVGQLMNVADPSVNDTGLITQIFNVKFRESKRLENDDFKFKLVTDKWSFGNRDDTVGGLRVDGVYA